MFEQPQYQELKKLKLHEKLPVNRTCTAMRAYNGVIYIFHEPINMETLRGEDADLIPAISTQFVPMSF